ncbi:MAG: hypothetical protein JWO21_2126 [Solirubrobacterales bacterium]|nr:hypothetical protein [Solirubrobacterales bacterium]
MIEIRSYRRVFDLERRLYRVDRLRLNPGGVPVRGIVYFLALLAASLIAAALPLAGGIARAMPWYLRDVALPGASATLLSMIRVEGRTFHLAAYALLRYRMSPRHLAGARPCGRPGGRWRPRDIVVLPDGSDSRLRRLRYTGPGAVLVAVEHERACDRVERAAGVSVGRRPAVTLTGLPGGRPLRRAQVISLGPRARLLVRPGAAGR